jgi:hypothetical protein
MGARGRTPAAAAASGALLLAAAALALPPGALGVANALADCLAFAALFPTNACAASNEPAASVAAIAGVPVSCNSPASANYSQLCANYGGALTNVSGGSGGYNCVWTARLCVTCSAAQPPTAFSPSRIRVQTNGLPAYCQNDASRGAMPLVYDWEVAFNPDVRAAPLTHSFSSAAELSAVLCTQQQYLETPAPSLPVVDRNTTDTFATALGIALGGTVIGSPCSGTVYKGLNVDPFSPPLQCEINNPVLCGAEKVDSALTHPNPDGVLHTHIMNKYLTGQFRGQQNVVACTTQCADLQGFALSQMAAFKTLTPLGLARDGHVIYGPYGSDGLQITTALDACNGGYVTAGADYGYIRLDHDLPVLCGLPRAGKLPGERDGALLHVHAALRIRALRLCARRQRWRQWQWRWRRRSGRTIGRAGRRSQCWRGGLRRGYARCGLLCAARARGCGAAVARRRRAARLRRRRASGGGWRKCRPRRQRHGVNVVRETNRASGCTAVKVLPPWQIWWRWAVARLCALRSQPFSPPPLGRRAQIYVGSGEILEMTTRVANYEIQSEGRPGGRLRAATS